MSAIAEVVKANLTKKTRQLSFAGPSLAGGICQVYIAMLSHSPLFSETLSSSLDGTCIAAPGDINSIAFKLEELTFKLDGNLAIRQTRSRLSRAVHLEPFRANLRAVIHK